MIERLVQVVARPALWITIVALVGALYVAGQVDEVWLEQRAVYQVTEDDDGERYYTYKGQRTPLGEVVPYETSPLRQAALDQLQGEAPALERQWVEESVLENGRQVQRIGQLTASYHFGPWSLLPAFVAIALCVATREPLTALLTAVVTGAFMLHRFDITDAVLIPSLSSQNAAAILLLYLWLLGGLMGIWNRTGAALAFASYMTRRFVRGPRSARLVAWAMGVVFFQGGTISVVLVGTVVKPVADAENISHEELAYIVDSTASPIAAVIPFNAWPIYVQALIFVPGVSFLATETDRLAFFFKSVPLSFYGFFAVLSTLLVSLGITRFAGPGIRLAAERARATGELDAPGAMPMGGARNAATGVAPGYTPHTAEFFIPLVLLLGTAVGTFFWLGTPKVNWAFGLAVLSAVLMALAKGMPLRSVVEGIGGGLQSVVLASVVLMLAVTIGGISQDIGAGTYLVELLGERVPFWALPVMLQVTTMVIAFSTGTSWGTYAIVFPLAMPLAWTVAQAQGVDSAMLFMSVCFACVLNGSVYGDQCSPISDTTVLSAMTTGCDLMDHVKTQIVPATAAAVIAGVLWTLVALMAA